MAQDNNPFYILAKNLMKIVILDNPEIYSEYAPYRYIGDLREFMNQAGNLNLAV